MNGMTGGPAGSMGMNQVEIRNLTKRYGESVAVDSVSFTTDEASFVVILGPSGCGKSTILRMIAGLEPPCGGEVRIGGRCVDRVDPAKRGVSMVFQSYALFPHLTVAENIVFGLKVRRVDKADRARRLESVARMVGLDAVLERKPAQLSGGQRQRVALARAVIAEHPVCLMDEPLSNLDAKLRNEMRLELRELQKRLGMTVIYVTHDQTEAMSMADLVVLMNKGRVEQLGPPEAIYADPASTFAARFIGVPPMNLLPLDAAVCAALPEGFLRAHGVFEAGEGVNGHLLGVRPEKLCLDPDGVLPATVVSTDYHGADTVVGVRVGDTGGEPVMVRVPGRVRMAPGETGRLAWDPDGLYVFDGNGKRQGP